MCRMGFAGGLQGDPDTARRSSAVRRGDSGLAGAKPGEGVPAQEDRRARDRAQLRPGFVMFPIEHPLLTLLIALLLGVLVFGRALP